MYRQRLHTAHSCCWCRERRKKCDGKKPRCGRCVERNGICAWVSSAEAKSLGPRLLPAEQQVVYDPGSGIESLLETSAAPDEALGTTPSDSSRSSREPTDERPFAFSELNNGYGVGQFLLTSTTAFSTMFDEHVIVSGIVSGWDRVTSGFLLDDQWPYIIGLDHELLRLNFPLVTRIAVLWFARMKMKVVASVSLGLPNEAPLPTWAISGLEHHMHMSPLINYLPWPSVRQMAASSPHRFCNPQWSNEYMKMGIAFAWPYKACSTYTLDTESCMMRFTPEFSLRVENLRSWTLRKDFLDKHPDLRGLAPQLEPSPTTRSVSNDSRTNALYWQLARRRHKKKLHLSHLRKARVAREDGSTDVSVALARAGDASVESVLDLIPTRTSNFDTAAG